MAMLQRLFWVCKSFLEKIARLNGRAFVWGMLPLAALTVTCVFGRVVGLVKPGDITCFLPFLAPVMGATSLFLAFQHWGSGKLQDASDEGLQAGVEDAEAAAKAAKDIAIAAKAAARANAFAAYKKAQEMKRRYLEFCRGAFPAKIREAGQVGHDIAAQKKVQREGNSRKSSGAPARPKKPQKKASADDGGPGDGEPPRSPLQLFLSYEHLALRWCCSEKNLYNKVSSGLLPRPVVLPGGKCFALEIIEAIEAAAAAAPPTKPKRPRGRPRLARVGKGGVR